MTEWGIDTLFNPGKRHMDEEKRRLQSTREEVGDSSGGRRIDLDNGKVVIARKKPTAPTTESTGKDPVGEAVGGSAGGDEELAIAEVETDSAEDVAESGS
jgi:hypothetical protein